ncbi:MULTISPECIES: ABC transporter ATP-binding protein [unclassified Breznakia]|uniref:ABC transporter ATP-binding protein n=1 Tax=unclassified Breznakia TaxID=2623764 RepID=UPI0024772396|nr:MULTISPECIES: ABC transporter ATP-binding protein [unclassified Breznakia]MDH6367461.1 ATP-binding cassette subfamily B multidrug efflux pump [Breznakia sp. PH1-1]MDH6404566.1 ATP-binding cassette subfamily B multidrug efflux pump [Breznakia sp. PF1-11]MDH6412275.1 ATP-binding cassette subfamily B multidrug efflux pump [Breznakia sp. PFB1-11]MDH6414628.1 ATP-binding cassette subfamily B multidrug efflux pump [Breznakia sp. PFB1-14]MDH6416999.1 ATP-binding cassette subfamily B multidrug effl
MNHKNDFYKETFTSSEQKVILKRLLSYLKPYTKPLIIALLTTVLATTCFVIAPLIMRWLVDNGLTGNTVHMDIIIQGALLYALMCSLYAILRFFQLIQLKRLGFKLCKDLRDTLFAKLEGMGMRYFDQTPAGSLVSRVTNDTEAIQEMVNEVLSVIVSSVVMIIGCVVAMSFMEWRLALFCLCFVPVAVLIMFYYQKLSTRYYLTAREKLSQLNTRLAESISGMNIIQIFNQEKRIASEFANTNNEYYEASMKNVRLDGLLLSPTIHLLIALALALMLTYMGFQSFAGLASVGMVVAFIEYIYRFFDPMFQIMDRLSIYQQAIVAAYRVFFILDHQEVAPMQDEKEDAKITEGRIEFKNVSFSYDGKHEVLKDISFVIEPGETLALVGHTGSGKSSIINVMMRFYEFTKGEILIDGISIKEYPMDELRKRIGLVLQDPFMYYGTIADNIRLKNKEISDEEIKEACKFVQADQFIDKLTDTYQYQVSERGASFSTGQKQLLAFARTIVTNPKILILDEATANIDTETESLIQEGLSRIKQGRTSIAIAHRLSTIKDANKILVLDNGRIIEAGNHESLIEKHGVYYAMYQLQKSGAQ